MAYDTWKVVNTTCHPQTLGQWNSVGTISNGYIGLKGNLAEQRHGFSAERLAAEGFAPVTLINGVYDELDMFSQIRASNEERRYLDPRYFDTAGRSPAVANLPNPLFVQVFIGEQELSLGRGEIGNFVQSLDLATGVYRYSFEYRDGAGRTTRVEMERFAALRHAHRAWMRYSLTPLDHEETIRVHSGISGDVFSNTTRERQFTVTERWAAPAERCRLTAHLPARDHIVRLGVLNRIVAPGSGADRRLPSAGIQREAVLEHDAAYTRYLFVRPYRGRTITLERAVVLTCSEDLRHGVVADLEHELDEAEKQGLEAALMEQRAGWDELWHRADVQIEGDDPAQLGLRFCLFHLLQAAPRFTDRLSVPVKLLTGEYYQGNTFYDTDTYILPFYSLVFPELARTCLNFRYEGLRAARESARNLGYDGAKFAWQAGPNGEECLGRWWRFPHTNIHINGDVVYALMQYWAASGDDRYLAERGIDLLVECARFYAARAEPDAGREAYHLRDVAGPDEGHCESTDNFYTNYVARRTLGWAADALEHLAQTDPTAHSAAARRLALKGDEPARWRQVAERLTFLFDPHTRVYEQCAGFYQLKPLPPDLLEGRKVWFVTVFPYQALNQPDVVMAMVLFRDDFPPAVRRANWGFYKDKSLNFSSMSFALNALMAADMAALHAADAAAEQRATSGAAAESGATGDTGAPAKSAAAAKTAAAVEPAAGVETGALSVVAARRGPAEPSGTAAAREMEEAYKNFIITCGEDLDEALTGRKDTYAGLHGTACGGAWMAAVFGFGGVTLPLENGKSGASGENSAQFSLRIHPNLPPQWAALRFNLMLRGVTLRVAIDRREVALTLGTERPVELPVEVAGRAVLLRPGEGQVIAYAPATAEVPLP